MRRWLLGALLALLIPTPAFAQAREAAPGIWTRADGRATFAAGKISLPERLTTLTLSQISESSNHGQGIDSAVRLESPDKEVFATVYVYSPNLAHAGLSAFATEDALKSVGGASLRHLGTQLVPAGGREAAAIRTDFANYRGDLASSAAFMNAGRWIVKVRVSGPQTRRVEVEQAMTALLAGMRFEGPVQPRRPEQLQVGPCGTAAVPVAATRPSLEEDDLEEAIIGTVESDEQARDRDGSDILTPRFGPRWCLSEVARIGNRTIPILRSQMTAEGRRMRSVMVAIINDAGLVLEAVDTRRKGRFVLFLHDIGQSELLGAWDGPPSNAQIVEVLSGRDRDGGRVRALISRRGDRETKIELRRSTDPTT
jgi:hypothetical protein